MHILVTLSPSHLLYNPIYGVVEPVQAVKGPSMYVTCSNTMLHLSWFAL